MITVISRKWLLLLAGLLATLALPEGLGSAAVPQGNQGNAALLGAKKKRRPLQGPHRIHAEYSYRVDRRHPAWGVAAFPNQPTASRFASQMRRKHFRTKTVHAGRTWQVRYAMLHWHRGRTTLNPFYAQQIAIGLQRQGYQTRVVRHLHRVF
jgi:hypothetical protein